jgi:DNA-binding MarR family transcriptional regulator
MKNTLKNIDSKAKILRSKRTKILFDQKMVLHKDIASLSPDAFKILTPCQERLLSWLLARKSPLIYFSYATIAKDLGYAQKYLCKAMKALKELGLITWYQRYNSSNVYRLNDIVYTYQFRQTYKEQFYGLKHPSFYALLPEALRAKFKENVTLLVMFNFLNKKNCIFFNKEENALSWFATLTASLSSARDKSTKKREYFPLNSRMRNSHTPVCGAKQGTNVLLTQPPSSAAPLPTKKHMSEQEQLYSKECLHGKWIIEEKACYVMKKGSRTKLSYGKGCVDCMPLWDKMKFWQFDKARKRAWEQKLAMQHNSQKYTLKFAREVPKEMPPTDEQVRAFLASL